MLDYHLGNGLVGLIARRDRAHLRQAQRGAKLGADLDHVEAALAGEPDMAGLLDIADMRRAAATRRRPP